MSCGNDVYTCTVCLKQFVQLSLLGRMTIVVYIQNKYMIENVPTCTVQQKTFALGSSVRILRRSLFRICN
jgi:hypothetical protein